MITSKIKIKLFLLDISNENPIFEILLISENNVKKNKKNRD